MPPHHALLPACSARALRCSIAAGERHPALAHLPILSCLSQVLAAHRILSAPVVVGNGSEAGAAAGQQVDKAPEVGAGRGCFCQRLCVGLFGNSRQAVPGASQVVLLRGSRGLVGSACLPGVLLHATCIAPLPPRRLLVPTADCKCSGGPSLQVCGFIDIRDLLSSFLHGKGRPQLTRGCLALPFVMPFSSSQRTRCPLPCW